MQRIRKGGEVMKITFLGLAVIVAVVLIVYAVSIPKRPTEENDGH
jgi:hypothetical protein